jgi:hypothetical protein
MKFSYSEVWADTVRLLRANASLLAAVAGVFLFLPSLILGYVAPQPSPEPGSDVLAAMAEHFSENWLIILVVSTIGFIGNLVILLLVLDVGRHTVGGAIRASFGFLPVYFAVSLLAIMMIAAGTVLFILPGLYLMGRLAVIGPIVVAEPQRGAIETLKRSFERSKGRGWAIAGLILLLVFVYWLISVIATVAIGSIFLLAERAIGADGVGAFLILVMEVAIGAAFQTVLIVLFAAVYRRLASGEVSTSGI